jgi:uncharacterized circularly permuted ATP-grasp superfamily protein/uncharacterized alpha-E superfamily protein
MSVSARPADFTPQGMPGWPYTPPAGAYDEMMAPDGSIRPHWRTFTDFLSHSRSEDLDTRAAEIRRLLKSHGVTYNLHDDSAGASRPWTLDVLPFVVPSGEFERISRGLNQRARLLEELLADIYGAQRMLRGGLLPPSLVFANPGFMRPACGVEPAGGRFLSLVAFDLVRGPAGQWMTLADRAQSPSAHGYALENRIILSNVCQEEFHTARTRPLAGYYERMRESLRCLSPSGRRGEAGIVMMTPGPSHDTYFEHAFKARHLGFPLAEGADLTVRERRLCLKTLEGLKRVDVLLRHVDDAVCDPLELGSDTDLGVAGLLEAWRSGNIALVNGIGAAAAETPALHPFLPGLCRALLGEELVLPSIPSWWCGQPRELSLVLAAPEKWVLKKAFSTGPREPVFMDQLGRADREAMLARVKAEPEAWVAQERTLLSTTPTWSGGRVVPRQLVWRVLGCASNRGEFGFMPGGLCRVSSGADRWVISMRSGSLSKDVWVTSEISSTADATAILADGPPAVRTPPAVIRPARPPGGVPSRAADHLFWLGRYAERLEQAVRALRVSLARLSGEGSATQAAEAVCCEDLLRSAKMLPAAAGLLSHLPSLLRDPGVPGSLPDLIQRIRFNAAAARDRLSDDTWRLVNRIENDARPAAEAVNASSASALLDALVLDLAAFSGMHLENVTRGHGWRFLELGRRLERADVTMALLNAATEQAVADDRILGPLLEIFDSSMTYRRLHFARPALLPVLDLLMLDASNPRSTIFQIQGLGRLLRDLPPGKPGGISELAEVEHLHSQLSGFPIARLASTPEQIVPTVQTLAEHMEQQIQSVSDALTERYFSHAVRAVH